MVPFVLFGALIIGILCAGVVELVIPIWWQFFASILVPTIGMVGVYILAPSHKLYVVGLSVIAGFVLVFYTIFPSFYPEWHHKAYTATYIPFILVVLTVVVNFYLLVHSKVGKWFIT